MFTAILISGETNNILNLNKNWKIQSSAEIEKSGNIICSADFNAEVWYPTSIPKTVLATLVENGLYPDPYYGSYLKSISGYREGRWLAMPKNSPFYPLETSYWFADEGEEKVANVVVKNPTSSLAFMIHLAVIRDKNGDEVAPTYLSDNYFCLLPGESREISGRFSKEDLGKAVPKVKIIGWNVE